MDPVSTLRRAGNVPDVRHQGHAQPHVEVSGVGQHGVVAADRTLDVQSQNGSRCRHNVHGLPAPLSQPRRAGVDDLPRTTNGFPARTGTVAELFDPAIGHPHTGVGLHQAHRALERTVREFVVGREQRDVAPGGPTQKALVVGRDVALVLFVGEKFDLRISCSEFSGDRSGVVLGGIVDDEHSGANALLSDDAAHATLQKSSVVVAGDHHRDDGWLDHLSPNTRSAVRGVHGDG